jgi:hypothetical protein
MGNNAFLNIIMIFIKGWNKPYQKYSFDENYTDRGLPQNQASSNIPFPLHRIPMNIIHMAVNSILHSDLLMLRARTVTVWFHCDPNFLTDDFFRSSHL